MMASVREYVRAWRQRHPDLSPVAELGSYDINGGIRDIVPVTGFDILRGRGVDVVIEPGVIPAEHCGIYQAVLSLDSFPYCPRPDAYICQILDLLAPGGHLLLIACNANCTHQHTSSPNKYGWTDSVRWSNEQFAERLGAWFDGQVTPLSGDRMAYEGVRHG